MILSEWFRRPDRNDRTVAEEALEDAVDGLEAIAYGNGTVEGAKELAAETLERVRARLAGEVPT